MCCERYVTGTIGLLELQSRELGDILLHVP
jgi:hypothetical protein